MLTERLMLFFNTLGVDWVMYILIALSILSLTVIIEKRLLLWREERERRKFLNRLHKTGGGGSYLSDLKETVSIPLCVEAKILAKALNPNSGESGKISKERFDSAAEAVVVLERQRLQRFLPFLGTVGNNAPFIGLFGTVIGIMGAFYHLKDVSDAADRTEHVMVSIAEALVATAMGILVAIPAVIAYNYYRSRINNLFENARTSAFDLLSR